MIEVTGKQWEDIPKDFKGIFVDYGNEAPEHKGQRCVLAGCIEKNGGTALLIEGLHFEIVDSRGGKK